MTGKGKGRAKLNGNQWSVFMLFLQQASPQFYRTSIPAIFHYSRNGRTSRPQTLGSTMRRYVT